jgi:hypothetical protein
MSLALILGGGGACARIRAEANPLAPGGTVRMTAQPVAAMPGRRVSALLDFDSPEDITFITSDPAGAAAYDGRVKRSGRASLRMPAGTREVVVKLPSLLSGRSFPADWTLLGAYVYADRPAYVTMSYEVGEQVLLSRSVSIAAGVWTPVMLDLATLANSNSDAVGVLRLTFDARSQANVHIDDVTLVDNNETVVDTTRDSGSGAWSVRRRGLYYVIDAPGYFAFVIPTANAEQGGWSVSDASAARVRFTSANAPGTLTIYADGRMYWGGAFRAVTPAMSDATEQARQHLGPAAVDVPETMGRLNRSTAGDENNDGYNESRGAYEITANGPRVELTLSPRTSVLSRPVLEIAGLPSGSVMVNIEGTLIPDAARLPNGDVLVELPARIERATQVSVRVQ